ncbi:AAA family ATPase [Melioribacter sp. Ez-97]|uniref:AAA family ATPase n=1 Tax=Melioribacter sp. Ez-97 TaxID=3423434 RepID=UPI003ED93DC1
MILRINKIKNFGIFKDFSWNGLDDFKKKNLIYGWNYSGKTTLSKLFQNLEFKDKDKFFAGSEFNIIIFKENVNKDYGENELENFPFDVKVFNTNYIKRIFTWDNPYSDIQPISFFLGDPSGELDKKIKKICKYNQILNKRAECLKSQYIDEFEKYNKLNGKFSLKAKEIRENYLNNKLDQNKLNKGTILEITNRIKVNIEEYILSDEERDKAKAEAIAENTYETQKEDFSFQENLETLAKKVKSILEDTAPKSISFPELDENEELFNWVQIGLKLHKDSTECKFCTKTLPDNRIDDLNSYYSKKLQEIQSAITRTLESITSERKKIEINFFDKKNLAPSFQEDYQKSIDNYKETAKKYEVQLSILENDLKRKNSQLFNNIQATEIEVVSLNEDFESIKKSVKAHNDWISEFDNNKMQALEKILNHYVAEYLREEDYITKEKNKNRAVEIITNIESKIFANDSAKLELETQLKSTVKGQKELNEILKILLHRDDIK